MTVVIGIDPGQVKCGVAAVSEEGVIAREICPVERLAARVSEMASRTGAEFVFIGGGTNGRKLAKALSGFPGIPSLQIVDEANSTIEAKKRYFKEHPPVGLKRLIPSGLLIPPVPVDDWVAVILAERGLTPFQKPD